MGKTFNKVFITRDCLLTGEQTEKDMQLQYIQHFGNEKELNNNKLIRLNKDYENNYSKLNDVLIKRNDLEIKNVKQLIQYFMDNQYN